MTDESPTSSGRAGFPATRGSAVAGVRSDDAAVRSASFDALVAAYWRPAYAHLRLRRRRSREDAEDLVQGFFARALEKSWFDAFDGAKGRFRTFFRVCLEGYVANEDQAATRLKRGGGARTSGFDFASEEGELVRVEPSTPDAVERACDTAWTRGLFATAVARLRDDCTAHGRDLHFRLFERYDLDPPNDARLTYDALAAEFGIKTTDVVNRLALARREFRRHVLDVLRDVTATDDEFREEARIVLGLDLP